MEYDEFAEIELPRLLGLAHAMTGDPHDAWDLTQETLARVASRWRRIDSPGPYARMVMSRLNVDRIRHVRRVRPTDVVPDSAVEPHLVGDVDGWLVEALATLSPKQRTALALRYVEDLDVRGIADRMGCSEGTVRSHLSRGTDRLKEHARGREQEPHA